MTRVFALEVSPAATAPRPECTLPMASFHPLRETARSYLKLHACCLPSGPLPCGCCWFRCDRLKPVNAISAVARNPLQSACAYPALEIAHACLRDEHAESNCRYYEKAPRIHSAGLA